MSIKYTPELFRKQEITDVEPTPQEKGLMDLIYRAEGKLLGHINDVDNRTTGAMVVAILSIVLWIVYGIVLLCQQAAK